MLCLPYLLLSAGAATAQLTAANSSVRGIAPTIKPRAPFTYNPDGRSCCVTGTQYSPEACSDPGSKLGPDNYITACCIDGDQFIVHYANFKDKPLTFPVSMSDSVHIEGDTPVTVIYNVTKVSLHHGTLYVDITLKVLVTLLEFTQSSNIEVQLARTYADAGVFDIQVAPVVGAIIANVQTRVNDDQTVDLRADIFGSSALAAVETSFETKIDDKLVKLLLGAYQLCDQSSLEECAWQGTAPFCAGECPANGGWKLKREGRCGDGNCCTAGIKARCCRRKQYLGDCQWFGTAPFCEGTCPSGWIEDRQDSCGDGSCCGTGHKALCCPPSVG